MEPFSVEQRPPAMRRQVRCIARCSGSEVGSYLRRIDSCIIQLKAQGPLLLPCMPRAVVATLEATQGQILSQSPTDLVAFVWELTK